MLTVRQSIYDEIENTCDDRHAVAKKQKTGYVQNLEEGSKRKYPLFLKIPEFP